MLLLKPTRQRYGKIALWTQGERPALEQVGNPLSFLLFVTRRRQNPVHDKAEAETKNQSDHSPE